MSAEYKDQDVRDIARAAERDLNSHAAKHGHSTSDTALESGVDAGVTAKFPGSSVVIGSAASGAGDNREIPVEEGGDIDDAGRPTKAKDFEGEGGPETKKQIYEEEHGGNDDVRGNIRQGTETRRP